MSLPVPLVSPAPPAPSAAGVDGPEVSIVIPVYNEAENLPDLVRRVGEALVPTGRSFELILVDDGSRDATAALMREAAARTPWLVPVVLARNYGQSSALQAGFDRVRGRYVVTLDGDLQNDPLDIPVLLDRLDADASVDMLSGWRRDRQDAEISRKLPSRIANALI